MDTWPVGTQTSERYPIWTRANAGEAFPDPVAPLSFGLLLEGARGGALDGLCKMGAFTHDEFEESAADVIGVFGGYCYLNASLFRVFGERAPGMSAQAMDDAFFGAQPGIPPYVAQDGDQSEERSAELAARAGPASAVRFHRRHAFSHAGQRRRTQPEGIGGPGRGRRGPAQLGDRGTPHHQPGHRDPTERHKYSIVQ